MLKVIADSTADRDGWLQERKRLITASVAWKLVCEPEKPGQDLRKELLMEKAGLAAPFEPSGVVRAGSHFEPDVVGWYRKEGAKDWGLTPFGLLLGDPECSALAATPDAIAWDHPDAPGVPIPVDAKWGMKAWAPRRDDVLAALAEAGIQHGYTKLSDIQEDKELWQTALALTSLMPEYVQVQLQVQCAVLGAPFAATARMSWGGEPLIMTMPRHDGLIERLRSEATALMHDVERLKRGEVA
jgi:hypothetical protein